MTEEDIKLLLTDLSARLTHNVKAYVKNWSKFDRKYYEGVYTVESIHPSLNNILVYSERCSVEVIVGYDDYEIKPYLFPLSSMTDEQKLHAMFHGIDIDNIKNYDKIRLSTEGFDWLNANNFDYRGLIEKGLAIDCTNLNIY